MLISNINVQSWIPREIQYDWTHRLNDSLLDSIHNSIYHVTGKTNSPLTFVRITDQERHSNASPKVHRPSASYNVWLLTSRYLKRRKFNTGNYKFRDKAKKGVERSACTRQEQIEETDHGVCSLAISRTTWLATGNMKPTQANILGRCSAQPLNRRTIVEEYDENAIYIRANAIVWVVVEPRSSPKTTATSLNFPLCYYFVKRIAIKWTSVKQTYTGRDVSVGKRLFRGRMFIHRASPGTLNARHRWCTCYEITKFSTKIV